ncbi:MAG: SDR family oxidoreductase [Actinomycetota bacterium]
MDLGLTGRAYVVTAGSRGLGFATARALVDDGAHVLIAGRDASALARASNDLGSSAHTIAVDLASAVAAQQLLDVAMTSLGRIDGVLVNVGGPAPGRSLDYTDEQWRVAIDGVLLATVRIMRAFSPAIVDGGSLLTVLSTTVREPIEGLGASNVLRPGLAMLVKELSLALAPRVRVNGILPGRIATDRMLALTSGDPGVRRQIEESIPLRRLGDPSEFGRVAAFLLSPASSYVTGALVPVDGGILHSPW